MPEGVFEEAFCFRLLHFRIRSALRSLVSLCLTSSHKALFFCRCVTFLQFLRSCWRLGGQSLFPFFPFFSSSLSAPGRSSDCRSLRQTFILLAKIPPVSPSSQCQVSPMLLLHLLLAILLLLTGFSCSSLCELLATGSWCSRGGSPSTSGSSSSVTSLPSATLAPSALWFSTCLSVPLVSPAKAVQGCCGPF